MSPRLSFLPCDPLRVNEVGTGRQELAHGPDQGGTDNRRPVVREGAGLWCVDADPMGWGLDAAALGTAAALSALGLGPDIFGPRK